MKYLYALTVLLMALFLAAFIQQNGQDVVLKYFYWRTIPLPLSLFMILAFAAGYALAVAVGLSTGIRGRVRTMSAQREARRLRTELGNLKESREAEFSTVSFADAGSAPEQAGDVDEKEEKEPGLPGDGSDDVKTGGGEKGKR